MEPGKCKKRMGRPPINEDKRRSKLIALRVRQDEYDRLVAEATAAGKTLSAYLLAPRLGVKK